jgi:hypothetical protein
MGDDDKAEKAEEDRTEHDKERSESKRDEAESPGSGGGGIFDDPASSNAKDAGKADAEAERAQEKSDD